MARRTSTRRGSATLRDVLVVAGVLVALLWAGAATDAFEQVHDWLRRRFPGADDEILVGFATGCIALVVLAIRLARAAGREASGRTEAEGRFRALVEEMPAVTYTWDPRRPMGSAPPPYVSPQVESILGFTADAWRANPRLRVERIHPEDRDRVVAASDRADRSGAPVALEYRHVKPDGTTIWIRDEALVVERDDAGRPTLVQGLMYDVTERKRAEERLATAEERYRALVERVPAVTYTWDAAFRSGEAPAAYISPQIRALLGYAPEEFDDPALWARLVHPEDLPRVMREWEACERGDVAFRSEYRMVDRGGRELWVRDEAVPIGTDDDGHPRFQGVIFDITERRAAEERLRAAELRYRSLVEHMPVVTYLHDSLSGRLTRYVAPTIEQLVGYSEQEWLADARLWEATVHPDDRARVLAEARRTDATGEPFRMEYRMVRRDGSVVWVHDEARVVEQGQTADQVVWQGMYIDITAGKEAEIRLREAEETYRTLVEQLPVVVYQDAVDDTSTALYVSPQYERMFGYPPSARLEDPDFWIEHLHPDDRERVLEESRRTNATGDPFMQEYRFLASDGRWVWVRDEAILIRDAGGRASHWQGVLIDITERRVAETLLADAERRYRSLVETMPAVTYLQGPEPGDPVTYVSPQVEAMLGYPIEEWGTGSTLWRSTVHPDDLDRVLEADRAADATGTFAVEYRQRHRDGSWVWVRDEAVLIRDDTGSPLFWQGMRIDISGQKLAEQQLREAEERYRLLVERLPAVTYLEAVDETSSTIYVSPQVEAIFGYTREEWADVAVWDAALHPDDRAAVLAATERHNRHGEPFDLVYRFRAKDGRWVWVEDHATVVRDDDGRVLFSQGVLFDITERREAEEQLRETEAKYRALVEHIPAVLYIDPPDQTAATVYVSPQVEDVLGVPQREYLEHPDRWRDLIHPDDRGWMFAAYERSLAQHEGWAVEYRVVRPDGRLVWIRDESAFLLDDDGRPMLVQGVMTDITERKLAEEKLLESERREREAAERLRALDEMKNTFLAAVSHELRSPLTSILGTALTLEHQDLPRDEQRDLTQRLAQNARKLDRLLKDLLDVDRLSRGLITAQVRPTDVGSLVVRTVESLELGEREVRVETTTHDVVVSVDAPKLERIVENLVMNAVRHTAPGVGIWVRTWRQDGGAVVAVEDDGPGVPADLRDEIFEPFRQGPTASPHSPGTGIGLSLVAMFAELHGGRAWVEERDGGGASFRVFLPGSFVPDDATPDATARTRGSATLDGVRAG